MLLGGKSASKERMRIAKTVRGPLETTTIEEAAVAEEESIVHVRLMRTKKREERREE